MLVLFIVMAMAPPQVVLAAEHVPKPTPRPAAAAPKQEPKPAAPPAPVSTARDWSAAEIEEERRKCRTLLGGLDLDAEPLAPIGQSGACGAPAPVLVTQVAGVALRPSATLTCDMAAALHGWVSGALKPAARDRLNAEVSAINTATSYACRRRNNLSTGKMSEHSRANALDMSGFAFAPRDEAAAVTVGKWGEGIALAAGVSRDGSFLEAVRQGACQHFTTVLGPGSDPYHGDHFHVDVLRRKNDYRICQ